MCLDFLGKAQETLEKRLTIILSNIEDFLSAFCCKLFSDNFQCWPRSDNKSVLIFHTIMFIFEFILQLGHFDKIIEVTIFCVPGNKKQPGSHDIAIFRTNQHMYSLSEYCRGWSQLVTGRVVTRVKGLRYFTFIILAVSTFQHGAIAPCSTGGKQNLITARSLQPLLQSKF